MRGRIVGAVTFNHGKWLEYYGALIEKSALFPPPPPSFDKPADAKPVPADFPDPRTPTALEPLRRREKLHSVKQ